MGLSIHNTDTQDTKISEPVLPIITIAPWYGKNDTLHTDLNITDVSTTIDKTYTKLHLTMREHANPLIQDTAQHLPPPRIARHLTTYKSLSTYKTSTAKECRWATHPHTSLKIPLHESHQNHMFSDKNEV
jgi:hypothetical protein